MNRNGWPFRVRATNGSRRTNPKLAPKAICSISKMSYFKSRPFCFAFAIGFAAGVVFVSVGAAILILCFGR